MIRFVIESVGRLARWRGLAAALMLSLALQVLYQIGTPLLFKIIFDDAIAVRRFDVLIAAIASLGGLLVILGVAGVLQEAVMARLAVRSVNVLRSAIFDRIQAHGPDFFEQTSTGVIGERFGSDIAAIELAILRAVPAVLLHGTVILAACVLLIMIRWQLALVAFGSMTAIILAPLLFAGRSERAGRALNEATTALAGMVQESAFAQLIVRIFDLRPARREMFQNRLAAIAALGAKSHFQTGMIARSTYIASGFTQIVVVGTGAYLAFRGAITTGEFIAFVGLLLNIGESVSNLTTVVPLLASGAAAMKRVEEVVARQPVCLESPNARPIGAFDKDIRFENVSFSYDGSRQALNNVSVVIGKGESVAFVGPSGCGKSTMLSLILRLRLPGSGRILIDDTPNENITESSLRNLMATVPQTPVLLSGSIRQNLLLAAPSASEADLHRALQAAAIDAAVSGLPEGLDTSVGSAGGQLSGGERQRVAIARALLRNSPILVLDEATSALDPASESQINRAILAEAGRRTIVAVTHRLSSVVQFDRIVVFEDGRVVESGNHGDLLANGGLYQKLWEKQHGFEIAADDAMASVSPERLRAIPFLSTADQDTLEQFANTLVFERFHEGSYICRQRDRGDKFYILMRGTIEILATDRNGSTRLLRTLTDGDFFGEIALVENRPRTASVRARTECWCLALPRKSFLLQLAKDQALADVIRNGIRSRLKEQSSL